jgi:hypothetical protein
MNKHPLVEFKEFIFNKLPLPEGVITLAESSYYDDDLKGVLYLRRNLLLDFSNCTDKEIPQCDFTDGFSEANFRSKCFFFYVFLLEDTFDIKLRYPRLSGRKGEDVHLPFNDILSGAIRFEVEDEIKNIWHADFAFTVRILSDHGDRPCFGASPE